MAQHSIFSILVLSALFLSTGLLSGCAPQLHPSQRYSAERYLFEYKTRNPTTNETTTNQPTSLSSNIPGVAISQTQPPWLKSITFFSKTPFSADRAKPCIDKFIPLPDNGAKTKAITYVGRDIVNTLGRLTISSQPFSLQPDKYQIAFQLSAFGQRNGIHYGFNQLGLTREGAIDITNHNYKSISPTSPDAQLVYQSLEMLYQQLDECMAEGKAEVEDQ